MNSFKRCRHFTIPSMLVLVCLLWAIPCAAEQPHRPLTSLRAIHAISNETAALSVPVAFEASVTYYQKGNIDLFVQDGNEAIYVEAPSDLNLQTGDRVLVEGITRASFRPEILSNRVTFVRHGAPPQPADVGFAQLIRAEFDCRRVKLHAVVRAANVVSDGTSTNILLDLLMPGGYIQAQVSNGGFDTDLRALLDSEIELAGAAAGRFDSKSQMTGVVVEVPSFSDVRIVKTPKTGLNQLPVRPFDQILQASQVRDRTERVRVQGTITYYQPGAAMVLQNGESALWVDTASQQPHRIGDTAVVSGFPDVRNGSVVLSRAEIESVASAVRFQPAIVDARQLASGSRAFELISVEGQLVMRVREVAQDQYVIVSQGHVFSAIYRHPERGLDLPVSPMQNLRLGSRVRVTGICVLDKGDQFRGQVAFHLLLRSSQDIALVEGPSFVAVRNLAILLGILLIAIFVIIWRSLLLERRLHRQSLASSAAVERWRSRVIDGINNAIPLSETLLQITELLAFKLQAEHSWAEVELEGTFGNCPATADRVRLQVLERVIPARSGQALGKICVAFPAGSNLRVSTEELSDVARLAALAIETGGKYSDLVRRSELDALTNVQNRFSFERSLDRAIEQGTTSGGKVALLYIDLDGFKEVNDQYGHKIGDCYLQEVASRLRHQLRPDDTLARIGGDEFAVIVASLSDLTEIAEIACRLQHCFDSPFALENHEIRGFASIGMAVFPDDSATRAELLECADARMYQAKRQRRRSLFKVPASA